MSTTDEILSEARAIVQDAFNGLRDIVTPEDFIIFQATSLEDVKNSARLLENTLATRQDIPNTGRLNFLFRACTRYNAAAAELHRGTTSMSLLWVCQPMLLKAAATSLY